VEPKAGRLKQLGSSRQGWAAREGLPDPLGATWIEEERAYNFALYSKHAEAVVLLLYGEDLIRPAFTYRFDPRKNKSGRIWHCRLAESLLGGARYYAYSVQGPPPSGRFEWHAFDPDKVLLDPYAKAVFFPPGFERSAACRPGPNAGRAPLGLLDGDRRPFDWGEDRPPRHESSAVIYELHVRGFTRHESSGVRGEARGTYAGIIEKIPYLRDLGITAVELMPVLQHEPGGRDYWGYMPLNFLAPHDAYACAREGCDQHREFRAMVKALHAAGIEVLLDVVYNHTCEGDQTGPTYSFKGIDNSTYYLISDDPKRPYADYTGTGNTMNCANRYVRKMILDSMRAWICDMHVDGFRFDLASIFTRGPDGAINLHDPPIIGDIASEPDFARVRLIAEPWDPAGADELGRRFPGISWCQWNGYFRDALRRFVRGDAGMVPELMRRLYGSDDLFPDDRMHAFHPWQSINYVTCHDGFTLYDLVSYDEKRNWANGHENADGPRDNFSWNCGWEGDEGSPPEVDALRRRQAKNFCALLLLANGTPMIRAGDEFLQTQGGNNNPYNQDNETSWLDWRRQERYADVLVFFRKMIAFRKAHPSLGRSRFWRDDVAWFGAGRPVDMSPGSRAFAFLLRGGSERDDDLYVMINAGAEPVRFTIQEGLAGQWRRVVDTARESPEDFHDLEPGVTLASQGYDVGARSVVVLLRPRKGV
jgi:isoamylase